jgi:MFS transporter, Spinster family, sphingosine-1-phosphate transporter
LSPASPPTALPKGAWWALTLVALAQAMSLLDRQILAILAPAIKADLKVGDAEMGLLYGTVFALFYALFSLPLGRLADGWVRTKLLALSIAFWSAATALGGAASSFGMLAVSRLGVGIGEGSVSPAGTSLIYDYWAGWRRAGGVSGLPRATPRLGFAGGSSRSSSRRSPGSSWPSRSTACPNRRAGAWTAFPPHPTPRRSGRVLQSSARFCPSGIG